MKLRAFVATFLFVLITMVVSWVWTPSAIAFTEEQKIFLQSWRLVNQSYLDESFNNQNWWKVRQRYLRRSLHDRQETYDAIDEMLASLDEPFTRLLRPDRYHNLQISTAGELSGVGLQVNINPETGHLEVIAPLANSPAEAAGIGANDRIVKIDDVEADTLSLEDAAEKMRGKKGTIVTLLIQPAGKNENQTRSVEIVRDRISLNPVVAKLDDTVPDFPVGYLRLSEFSANATKEVKHAIKDLSQEGAKGYVLDLRNNPGGLLQAGIEIARLWLDDGAIVYTVNRQGTQDSFNAIGKAITDAPLVLLVNKGTASASEILAGALQDNERATLIGQRTFGKGLIQSLFELPDGAGLAVTVAKYETPNRHDIHKHGIEPDLVVEQESFLTYSRLATEKDEQYQAAVNLLRGDGVLANAG